MGPDDAMTEGRRLRPDFERDGVVCVRRLLDDEWIDRLRRSTEEILGTLEVADLTSMATTLARPEGSGEDGSGDDATSSGPTGRGRFYAGIDHWRRHAAFAQFARRSPIAALAAGLLGSAEIRLYEDSLLVKEPASRESTEFHTDEGYFHDTGEQVCTLWAPLDPVEDDRGGLRFVRGSHRSTTSFRPNLFVSRTPIDGTLGVEVPEIDLHHPDVTTFSMEPGDVTVHHYRTLHGAGPNNSRHIRRRAVSVRLCGDDARTRRKPGAPCKPHEEALEAGLPLAAAGDDVPLLWPR